MKRLLLFAALAITTPAVAAEKLINDAPENCTPAPDGRSISCLNAGYFTLGGYTGIRFKRDVWTIVNGKLQPPPSLTSTGGDSKEGARYALTQLRAEIDRRLAEIK